MKLAAKKNKILSAIMTCVLAITLMAGFPAVKAYAASGTVYSCTINRCYAHPVTGVIEDSGGESSYATGQGMENMDGWENKGKRQQYIWGVWQITGIREGDTWDETDELVGAVYEMLPESCSYKSKTWSYTVELGGYEASPIVRWFEYNIGNMLPTPAGYYLSFGEVKPGEEYARSRSAFSPCILTDEKEMLAFWGRRVYRMEKVVDYDDIVEGKDFFRADYGLWSGEWVVTEVLKSEKHDAEEYIGMNFSTMEDNEICDFYLVDIGEKSIEKLVEAMGLENEFFVVFYEFSEDCFWDKMILKDEMTVVLVKDNNYFWAKRMSEKDPAGLYGSYF